MPVKPWEKRAALDMAFGEAPDSLDRLDLLCSRANPDAVFSLVTSASNLKHLDIRGNGIDAEFGWKLIKAMKNSYLLLHTVNGMNVAALRENRVKHMNLVGFKSKKGVFGIEVTGAIFLAHFLMINKSLESLRFQNNDVGKEGAKALSQAIITNPESRIRTVNHMAQRQNTAKGIDFTLFRKGSVRSIDLSHCAITDEDIVFLSEWLDKYDSVESLDLSYNMIQDDGVHKLQRYLSNTTKLKKLNIAMTPLEARHVAALVKALNDNKTLESVNFHLGRVCGTESDKQQILHDLAMVLTHHPTIKEFGEGAPVHLKKIKTNAMKGYDPLAQKKVTAYRNDIALALWAIALCKPKSFTNLTYNNDRRPDGGYPDVVDFVPAYWPPISSICLQLKDILTHVDLAIPEGQLDVCDVMKFLAGSTKLKHFALRGFATADIKSVPAPWNESDGNLPPFLTELLKKRAMHWRCLNGFVSSTSALETFNNVPVGKYKVNSAERAMLLLFETCVDTTVQMTKSSSQTQLNVHFGRRADVPFVLHCMRLVDRAPYRVEMHYSPDLVYKRDKVVARANNWTQMSYQQHELAGFLADNTGSRASAPEFVHHIALKHPFVVSRIVEAMGTGAGGNIREFTIDALEKVLPSLVKSLHAGGKDVKLERIVVQRHWNTRRRIVKKYHEMGAPTVNGIQKEAYSEHDLLRALRALLTALPEFKMVSSPVGKWDAKNLSSSSLEEFAQKMSGILVQYPPVAGVYSPNVMVEFVFDPKYSKFPPRGYRRLGMMLPLAPAHRNIRRLNLANCMIKQEIKNTARSDEFADSSRPLWEGKMVNYRPHMFGPFEDKPMDYGSYKRFHWHPNIRIGSSDSEKFLKHQGFVVEKDLLRLIIVTLLKSPALTHLDLRGNGFDKDDVMVIIDQLDNNKHLKVLNGIPVIAKEASKLQRLTFDGTDVPCITSQMRETHAEDQAFGQDTCKYGTVEIDEGDGFLFASLVTPQNFSRLRHLSIAKHRIPDAALTYICDAIASLPTLESIDLQRIYVSNRGANMLIGVIIQRAQNLKSLNGLPVNLLRAEAASEKSGTVSSSGSILWNEFTLAVASRLKLWNALRITEDANVMEIDTRGLTDVGLRGIAGKWKFDARNVDAFHSARPLAIVKLDISSNKQITDTSLSDLCRNLLQPTAVPSLTYLDVRYCPKLRSRSAFELYYLLHPKIKPIKGVGTQKLHVINGIDVKHLNDCVKEGKPAPPFVVRLYAGARKAASTLSESDAHFLAHVLHMFPNVSHCHVHVEVSRHERTLAWRGDTRAESVDADSPFPTPTEDAADEVQKQIASAKKLFDSCPVSTRTQFSAIPLVPVRTPPSTLKGDVLVPVLSGARATSEAGGYFGQVVQALRQKKEASQHKLGAKVHQAKTKPYYVNNINAQRVHDCFRTLYSVDDVELTRDDVFDPRRRKGRANLAKVDFGPLFGICTSVDVQHLWFAPADHLPKMGKGTIGNLTHLNFTHNNFGDAGLRQLCSILVNSRANLVHLGLAYNNISDSGARHFCAALPHLDRLSSADLSHNFISETGGCALANTLGGYDLTKRESDVSSIKFLSLNLESNRIRDKGGMRFAEFITMNKYLQFLNLRDNEIGFMHDEAVAALVYSITDNPVLAVLDIRDNFCRKFGASYEKSRPPQKLMQDLLQEVSVAAFDEAEVYQGVFIRRKR